MDTKQWVDSCETCCCMYKGGSPEGGKLESIGVSEPFELIGMDFVGKLPTTGRNHKFILVVTDHFSKWAYAIPMNKITSKDVAFQLVTKVVLAGHGVPRRILTDRGSNFNSELAREVYRMLNIAKSTTSAYHPQCDGNTERFNGTLGSMLAKLMEDHPLDWDELLPYCVFAYNISVHKSTKLSPYYILYGREPKLPIDHMFGNATYEKEKPMSVYVQQLKSRLEEAAVIARANIEEAQQKQKANYDERKSHTLNPLEPGEKVWVRNYTKPKPGESPKFMKKWLGPFEIVDSSGDCKYLVKGENFPEQMVHVQRLRRHRERKEETTQEGTAPDTEPEATKTEGEDQQTTEPTKAKMEEPNQELTQNKEESEPEKDSEKKKEKGKRKIIEEEEEEDQKLEEGENQEEKIIRIITQSEQEGEKKYLVQWSSGGKSWLDEEDMNCPSLLVEFVKKQESQGSSSAPPHQLLQTLLEALEGFLKMLKHRPTLTLTNIKRQLRRDFVGDGNPFLKSRRVIVRLQNELSSAKTKDELITIIQRWVDQPNHTFIEEWDK